MGGGLECSFSKIPHSCPDRLLVLIKYLLEIAGQDQGQFYEFAEFLRSSVIVRHKMGGEFYGRHPLRDPLLEDVCGLSLYLPENEEAVSRYSSLALYKEVDLAGLYRRYFQLTAGLGAEVQLPETN